MSTLVLIDEGGGNFSDVLEFENETAGSSQRVTWRIDNTGNVSVIQPGSANIDFGTDVRITGKFSVGIAPQADGSVFLDKGAATGFILELTDSHPTNPFGILVNFTGGSPDDNTHRFLECIDSTTARLFIDSDGDVNNHDGIYGTISDRDLKDLIQDAASQWDDFMALRFRRWKFITDLEAYGDDAKWKLGLVANEVHETSPGLVSVADLRHDERDPEKPHIPDWKLTLKQSIVFMKGMKTLQEAMIRIEALEARP